MQVKIDDCSVSSLQKALSKACVNGVVFPEPQSSRPFPYMPEAAIENEKQFWMLGKNWKENWKGLERDVRSQYGNVSHLLLAQVGQLLEIFSEVAQNPAPFISLRTVDRTYMQRQGGRSVSAGWHRDASVLTMQHTLTGETLEYTPDDNVKRKYFDENQIQPFSDGDELALINPENYTSLSFGQIAILKGELRHKECDGDTKEFLSHFIDVEDTLDFNVGRGLIHRGNRETKFGRIVLTVSTHKIPDWIVK